MEPALKNGSGHWMLARASAVFFILLIGFSTLLEPFGRDQGIHATIAFALDEGLVTYRDVYNIKPPMTTGAHWLSQFLFGHAMVSIKLFDLCAALAVALGLVEITRRAGQSPLFAAATAFGFAVIYYSYGYWDHAQTDGWAGFLVVGAVLLMQSGWARQAGAARWRRMALAGAVLGLAFSFKYTIGGVGILIFTPLLIRARFYWRDFLSCVLGGVGFLIALWATMAATGAWGPFVEIQSFFTGYLGYERPGVRFVDEIRLLGMSSKVVPPLAGLGALALIVTAWRTRNAFLVTLTGLWIAAAWFSGQIQGKGFPYHYLPMVPPYAILIGAAVDGLYRIVPGRILRAAVVAATLAVLLIKSEAWHAGTNAVAALRSDDPFATYWDKLHKGPDYDIIETVAFAEQVAARRQAGDSLFVWGYETALYFLLQEPPRYRYPYAFIFIKDYYDGRYTDDLMARLQATPPKHFVVQKKDATPWVTGRPESSGEFLRQFEVLNRFLAEGYDQVLSTSRFDLFERRGAGT